MKKKVIIHSAALMCLQKSNKGLYFVDQEKLNEIIKNHQYLENLKN